jgi:small-conductance mechanosensitive channel
MEITDHRLMDVRSKQETRAETGSAGNRAKRRHSMITYAIAGIVFVGLYLALRFGMPALFGIYHALVQRLLVAGALVCVVMIATKETEWLITRKAHTPKTHYNIIRLIRLVSVLVAISIVVTFLFEKWYTAVVSLGLVSLILGFALQTPISSMIGWFYIIIRTPYRVGDRIQVGTFTGDVVEIGYLDTTLWEFAGDYLTNDLPSGRLIRFPNTMVLQSQVYNYSWDKFPFIWNEIPFHIAYESDLGFVESTIKKTAEAELGEDVKKNIERFKELAGQTPVDELDIKEYPFVVFRTNNNTWLEVSLTYLVAPKQAAVMRSKLIKSIVAALLKEPDKVMFPKSNAR